MFSKAIVRKPGNTLAHGLTTADIGVPDYYRALEQHQSYIDALNECGLEPIVLDPDDNFPDSVFVEDTALFTPYCAILLNPGAPSRRGEIHEIRGVVRQHFSEIEEIDPPGTIEGGDILMVGTHYYIGLSKRTNQTGADQLIKILNRYGMTGSVIRVENVLHLKTGCAYVENNTILMIGGLADEPAFYQFNKIVVPENESYAANCIWVNHKVIMPAGYPVTKQKILDAGYSVLEIDVSEFRKLDGGLSCLSLRF